MSTSLANDVLSYCTECGSPIGAVVGFCTQGVNIMR